MDWPNIGTGGLLVAIFFGLASWLGKVWANRILEKDRAKYETQMQTLLRDFERRSEKELFVHRLQFDKEFQVCQELWTKARKAAQTGIPFRIIAPASSDSFETRLQKLCDAVNELQRVVYDSRPFYAPQVYDSAKALIDALFELHLDAKYLPGMDPKKAHDAEAEMDRIMQCVNDRHIPNLGEAIRGRMFPMAVSA